MKTYIVKSGDTLGSIAQSHYGRPCWRSLWQINASTILAEQRRRNWSRKPEPDWIFPGTILHIPEVEADKGRTER